MIRNFRAASNAWYLNLRSVKLLTQLKAESDNSLDHSAINLNIIQNLASAIEGSTRSLLINHIEYSKYYDQANKDVNLDLKAIIDETLISLYKKSWNELVSLSNQLFRAKLQEYYSDNFETIQNLFHLRNVTAHGGVLIKKKSKIPLKPELGLESEVYTVAFDNKLGLTNYLVKENLISASMPEQTIYWEYFNDNVTNHFRKYSFKFMNDIYSNYLRNFQECDEIVKDRNIIKDYSDR